MLKNLIHKKNIFYITIPLTIVAFIFIGIFIFNFTGITNLVSNNFYNYISQDVEGQVAGEYDVKIAATNDPIFSFIQITDLHFGSYGGNFTRTTGLKTKINSLGIKPDLILVTGDIANSGSSAEYIDFKNAMNSIGIPYYPIPGDHLDGNGYKNVSDNYKTYLGANKINYTFDHKGIRFVMLSRYNSNIDETWLDNTLKNSELPIIVADHHIMYAPRTAGRANDKYNTDYNSILKQYSSKIVALLGGDAHINAVVNKGGIVNIVTQALVRKNCGFHEFIVYEDKIDVKLQEVGCADGGYEWPASTDTAHPNMISYNEGNADEKNFIINIDGTIDPSDCNGYTCSPNQTCSDWIDQSKLCCAVVCKDNNTGNNGNNNPFTPTQSKGMLNPPYPRIGQITFYPAGEAGPDIWENHDMLGYRSYGSRPASIAREIKEKNPNILLLGATGIGHEEIEQLTNKKLPLEYYAHYEGGCDKDDNLEKFAGSYLMNLSNECPNVNYIYGNQNFNNFFAEFLVKNTAWDYYDGLYLDTWWSSLQWYSRPNELDLNCDGNSDGVGVVNGRWSRGKETLINNIRALKPDAVIIPHEGGEKFFNGNAFEFWTQETVGSRGWNFNKTIDLLSSAVEPRVVYANSNAGSFVVLNEGKKWVGTLTGSVFRADFTSAQIVGAFFGHDEGTSFHRYTFIHDEYEGDLGYPTGNITNIVCSGPEWGRKCLKARYFDNGVIISNITGEAKTLCPSDLTGGPYHRFLGNQEPSWNNGAEFSDCINFKEFDGIMMFTRPIVLVTPIIIDNMLYNMTTIEQEPVKYIGDWKQAVDCSSGCKMAIKGDKYYAFRISWDRYGSGFALSEQGSGENTATYKPKINIPGKYEIFEWHGSIEGKTAATNVPYEIYINGQLNKIITVDQTQDQGQWNSLGTFDLAQGENNYIKISNNANGYVISDAIKFVNLASFIKEYVPTPPKVLSPDFNCDNKVDIQDFGILLSHWHKLHDVTANYKHNNCTNIKSIDLVIDKNNRVDSLDLSRLLSCWGIPSQTESPGCWVEQEAIVN